MAAPAPTPPAISSAPIESILIASGGSLGALCRVALEHSLAQMVPDALLGGPIALLVINVLGAAGLSGLLVWLDARRAPALLRPFLAVGFLGTFTSYSGILFFAESLRGEAAPGPALAYLVATFATGLIAYRATRALALRVTREPAS